MPAVSKLLEQIMANAWRNPNPAGLSESQAADLALLAGAEIEILSAAHLVQNIRHLVRPDRTFNHTWLWAPLRGQAKMRIGGKKQTVTPRDLVLIPAAVSHDAVALTSSFEVVSIHLRICLRGALSDKPLFGKTVHRLPDPADWHRQLDTVVSLERGHGHGNAGVPILRYLLMSLVRHGEPLLRSPATVDFRIAAALKRMQEQLESPPRLEDIRMEAGLGASQFNRLFRQATGMSPKDYCHGLRVQGALRLLRDSQLTIKQIAARLGYWDSQHLGREFRGRFGVTPGHFRRKG